MNAPLPGAENPRAEGGGPTGRRLDAQSEAQAGGIGTEGGGVDAVPGTDAFGVLAADGLEVPLEADLGAACHAMLLRLAGRAPDGLIANARRWLAERDAVSVARAVASYAVSSRMPLAEVDAQLVTALLAGAGIETAQAQKIETMEAEPPVDHRFAPARPEIVDAHADRLGHCLDLTVPPAPGWPEGLVDEFDIEAARAAYTIPGAAALWRAWRYPADAAPWPGPKRVHLLALKAADSSEQAVAEPYEAAAALQEKLEAAGERDPQVEAFVVDAELPAYQRSARARSALLWSARKSEVIRLAGVYDVADGPTGPGFSQERVRLSEEERERVADFLASGTLLLATTARLDDILDRDENGEVNATGVAAVPVNFRTDGVWVWSDAAQYYVERHGVSPDPGLLAHVRRSGGVRNRAEVPDAIGVFRALAALTSPSS